MRSVDEKNTDEVLQPPPTPLADGELEALSRELTDTFLAERLALSAGLWSRIEEAIPMAPAPVFVRISRVLGVLSIISCATVLLLLYRLYSYRAWGPVTVEHGFGLEIWFGLCLVSCAGLGFSYWLGGHFRIWTRYFSGEGLWSRVTSSGGLLWVRVASVFLLLVSCYGLWREISLYPM